MTPRQAARYREAVDTIAETTIAALGRGGIYTQLDARRLRAAVVERAKVRRLIGAEHD